MSEKVTIHTTRERAEALQQHLAHDYLGHTKRQELVRDLLEDVSKSLKPPTPAARASVFSSTKPLGD